LPGRVARAERDAGFGGDLAQERIGLADQHAAAVAAQSVRAHGAAMRHALERHQRGLDQPGARAIVEVRDQAEAAAVVFVPCLVQRTPTIAPPISSDSIHKRTEAARSGRG
jgi:hypothetical protein